MSTEEKKATVAIVGAGLVGSLNAIYFAQRGWKVDLFELRPDMRLNTESRKGKSINLALSERGLSALRATKLGLEDVILEASVPMKARMVHIGKEGKQMSQPYSVHGEHINAVDRARLNELLLTAAERMSNVTVYFEHRLSRVDFDKNQLEFITADNSTSVYESDLIVGADGAYSRTRQQIMRHMRLDFSQQYIDTGYCELIMPPARGPNGEDTFALDPNHLHIWPRHTFMLIALPNPDFSFTCTLFMPFKMFDDIKTEEQLMEFFKEHFNDAIPLIGEKSLKSSFFSNPRGSLVTVKASPHHLDDKAVIIGDAAHAMVPFYGQGMNCGFQDVEVLHNILDRHKVTPVVKNNTIQNLKEALDEYSRIRVKDAHAICDLALYNYYEMRHAVTSYRFLARKKLEGAIHLLFPNLIIPLYTMVSFSTLPYSRAIDRWHRQTRWLNAAMGTAAAATICATVAVGLMHKRQIVNSVKEVTESLRGLFTTITA
ncbi:hypothetical protein G6F70_006614 [Rhizopus microsporus]|uniref:Kynurenine 3-monooxygenase n=2 Tax=Rhizopus TaxID=4842 RepID=A0A367KHC1_RHIAZ|nr:hypothetical protein G6F71_001114 [Rhizopus microsporus]RCI01252.1 hypothetical protein CU097_010325 [Rhizopus azygosporus]KAG1197446.1 hypothetical protein G6F70_006614 [Rhizopus microsporus]KAG1212662.1 hypothetical protein G6F69_003516 [Rhizopus microsporus]KAG1230668.1 hypothetical protein G6F67_006306 [Rhizopus microsporus]